MNKKYLRKKFKKYNKFNPLNRYHLNKYLEKVQLFLIKRKNRGKFL